MRYYFSLLLFLIAAQSFGQAIPGNNSPQYFFNGSLSVGKGNSSGASASAYLEVGNGNDHKGFLLPRIDDTSSIISPVEGLFAYDKSIHSVKYFNGSNWKVAESINISNNSLKANGDYGQNWNGHSLYFYNLNNATFVLSSGVFQISGAGSYVVNTPNISFISSGGGAPLVLASPAGISLSTNSHTGVISTTNLTSNRSYELPDTSGTLVTDKYVNSIKVTVSTYASMIALSVGAKPIDFLVLMDENKGMSNTTYQYFPNPSGSPTLMWMASVKESY